MKRVIATIAVAAVSAVTAITTSFAAEPLKIGVLYPITGFGTIFADPALAGHNIAVDEINAAGGLLGREVVSVVRDSKLNPAAAAAAAKELITKERVEVLIGGVSSAVGLAISEVAKREKIVYMATIPKTIQMTTTRKHPYIFRTAATTDTEGGQAATIANDLGFDKVCTILMDYAYGRDLGTAFVNKLKKLRPSAEIVLQVWPKQGTTDYNAYITQIMAAGCDGVFSGVWGALFIPFSQQASPFGLFDQVKFVGAGEIGSQEVTGELKGNYPAGIWGNSYDVFYDDSVSPQHKPFVDKLKKVQKTEYAGGWPMAGYVGVKVLAAGIKKAGTTDPDALSKALEGLSVDTPVGRMTLDPATHQADTGQFWGEMTMTDKYDFMIMQPVKFLKGD